jgi:hypothetical protein
MMGGGGMVAGRRARSTGRRRFNCEQRLQLINAIGLVNDPNTSDNTNRQTVDQFLKILQRELEQATDLLVLQQTWQSISNLTGKPVPDLVRGRTRKLWIERLSREPFSETNAEECLNAIGSFDQKANQYHSWEISDITSIAKAFRNQNFGVLDSQSGWQRTLGSLLSSYSPKKQFAESIDYFEDVDANFIIYIAGHIDHASNKDEKDVINKIQRWCLDQLQRTNLNEQFLRRVYYVATRNSYIDYKTKPEIESHFTKLIQSKAKPLRLKLALLDHLSPRYKWQTDILPTSEISSSLKTPQHYVTFLSLAMKKNQLSRIPDVFTKLLSENKPYLDEVHSPMKLDLWNGPNEGQEEASGLTVFDQIVVTLEACPARALKFLIPNEEHLQENEEDYQRQLKAKNTLVARYRDSSGATKRKLERILKTIAPEVVDTE